MLQLMLAACARWPVGWVPVLLANTQHCTLLARPERCITSFFHCAACRRHAGFL